VNKFDINAEYQVDVADLAYLAGLTERRIQQLEAESIVSKIEHGKYDLVESIRAVVEYTRSTVRGTVASEAEKKERTRLTREKRLVAQMNREELAGQLVRVEVMRKHLFQLGREIKNNIETISDRVSPLVAGESDRAKVTAILDTEHRTALEGLTEKLAACLVEDPRVYVNADID